MTTQALNCPVVDQNITDPAFNQDPFPTLEQWRELGPVVYNAYHERYMLFSYRHCAKVLGNVRQFNSQGNAERFERVFGGPTMESIDSPRHHEMRGVWSPFFQREALQSQTDLVAGIVDERVEPFVTRIRAGETLDGLADMCRAIPTLVIASLLGVEDDMVTQFSSWSDAMAKTTTAAMDPTPEGARLVAEGTAATAMLNEYIAEEVSGGRASRGDGLMSMMVNHPFAASMTTREIIASNTQLVFAGNETTAKLMGSTLVLLAQHPEERRALAADPSAVPAALEEIHRLATITQTVPRHVCADGVAVDGVPLPKGAEIMPMLGAANRDPTRWDEPARFAIQRESKQHLGFGFGMHVCLGLNLARLEATIWLRRLLELLPDFELAGPVDYGRGFGVRGPLTVPLRAVGDTQ